MIALVSTGCGSTAKTNVQGQSNLSPLSSPITTAAPSTTATTKAAGLPGTPDSHPATTSRVTPGTVKTTPATTPSTVKTFVTLAPNSPTTFPPFPPATNSDLKSHTQTLQSAETGYPKGKVGDKLSFTGYLNYSAEKPDHIGFCINASATDACDIGAPPPSCPNQTQVPATAGKLAQVFLHSFATPGQYYIHFEAFTGCQFWLGGLTNATFSVVIS